MRSLHQQRSQIWIALLADVHPWPLCPELRLPGWLGALILGRDLFDMVEDESGEVAGLLLQPQAELFAEGILDAEAFHRRRRSVSGLFGGGGSSGSVGPKLAGGGEIQRKVVRPRQPRSCSARDS